MSRQVITKTVTIPWPDRAPRTLHAGEVLELSAAELTAVTTAGGTTRATQPRDLLGESAGAANSN